MKILSTSIRYARHIHEVELEIQDLDKSDYELIKEADRGNGCFGGNVIRDSQGKVIEIHVYTD